MLQSILAEHNDRNSISKLIVWHFPTHIMNLMVIDFKDIPLLHPIDQVPSKGSPNRFERNTNPKIMKMYKKYNHPVAFTYGIILKCCNICLNCLLHFSRCYKSSSQIDVSNLLFKKRNFTQLFHHHKIVLTHQ